MAIRQSVLALIGAISEGLTELRPSSAFSIDDVLALRTAAFEITGLTGSAGERGWYNELFRYFNDHLTEGELVVPPSLDSVRDDLQDVEQVLAPTWASRAIGASYVLDQLSDAQAGPGKDKPYRFLADALAASPAESEGSIHGSGRVETTVAEELAIQLNQTRGTTQQDYWETLKGLSGPPGTLNMAAASVQTRVALRKVKREYCTVAATTAEWPTISYSKLKSVIEPSNWSKFYHEFFCAMDVKGDDAQGWTRVHEAVSGECNRYLLRTALKFWKVERPNGSGLILNYDMDANRDGTDALVMVDNGYIWITPLIQGVDQGVRVRTSKELLISGMSATAMTKLAEMLGYATNAADMFFAASDYDGKNADPFDPSHSTKYAPTPDTSTTWPTIVPVMPGSIRDEMCRDTTDFIKDRLDSAHQITSDFAEDWYDGIDLDEFNEFADDVGEEVTEAAKEGFKKATENFRPKTPTP
jgi:hypothetical protein